MEERKSKELITIVVWREREREREKERHTERDRDRETQSLGRLETEASQELRDKVRRRKVS